MADILFIEGYFLLAPSFPQPNFIQCVVERHWYFSLWLPQILMQKLVEKSLKQQQKLQHMLANMPPGMREDIVATPLEPSLLDFLMLLPISVGFTFIW